MIHYKKVKNLIEEGYRYENKQVRDLHYYYTSACSPDLLEAEARVEYFEKLFENREQNISGDRRAKDLSRKISIMKGANLDTDLKYIEDPVVLQKHLTALLKVCYQARTN